MFSLPMVHVREEGILNSLTEETPRHIIEATIIFVAFHVLPAGRDLHGNAQRIQDL